MKIVKGDSIHPFAEAGAHHFYDLRLFYIRQQDDIVLLFGTSHFDIYEAVKRIGVNGDVNGHGDKFNFCE
jgi:hypothetical protein